MTTNLKKILAGTLSAVMLISSFAVFATDNDTDTLYHPDTKLELPDEEEANETIFDATEMPEDIPEDISADAITADTEDVPDVVITEPEIPAIPDMTIWDIPTRLDNWNDEFIMPLSLDEEYVASGKCGNNLTWTLDSEGTLTISGTGDMYYYRPITGSTSAPWSDYLDQLKRLVIENGVTSISYGAFEKCSGFTGSLVIPNTVTSIGGFAFDGCFGFDGTLILSNNITTIDSATFQMCSGFTGSLVIPDSVTSIGSGAFGNCSGFTGDLVIPDSVTSIGLGAFGNCSGFTGDLVIPDSVTSIGLGAFQDCRGLTGNIVIPNSVTAVGERSFQNCSGLTDMYILKSEDSIETGGFPNKIHWKYDLSKCTASINNQICTGEAIIPSENSITVTSQNGKTLYYGTDYIIDTDSISNNINVGTATARIVPPAGGISTSSQDVPFNIVGIDLSDAEVTFPENITWNGAAVEPEPTLILDGVTLIKDKDYTITYSNNVFIADDFPTKDTTNTATAIITGIGNYIGGLSKDFEVKYFDPQGGRDNVDIRIPQLVSATIDGTFVYNGAEHKPTPKLVYHFVNQTTNVAIDYEMVEGEDFEIVSYADNINAGQAVVTVEGIGAFEHTLRIAFDISPCELSAATIADIPSFEYCKKDICPDVEIKVGDKVMTNGIDYDLSYENNRNRGTASVTITGKGNLTGVITKTFEITPRDGSRFTYYIILP